MVATYNFGSVYVVGTKKYRLDETVLFCTHNVLFGRK